MLATNYESPVHLIRNGKQNSACISLRKLGYTEEDVEMRYASIAGSFKRTNLPNIFQRILDPLVWKPFLIVTGLQIAQQFAMMGILNKYIVAIFQDLFQARSENQEINKNLVSCKRNFEPYLGAVLIGVIRIVASLTLSTIVDQYKRRRIYLLSGNMIIHDFHRTRAFFSKKSRKYFIKCQSIFF